MAKNPLPSPELLRQLLSYDPETGKLFWRERTPDMFVGGNAARVNRCKGWNSRYAFQEAFTANSNGYRDGSICGQKFLAHRVIWVMCHGKWPDQIDHINHSRSDNRIKNLRSVTRAENQRNMSLRNTNKSGYSGVCWREGQGRWHSAIWSKGKKVHLGSFLEKADAIKARKAAEIKNGYHENHGRK